jgi:hypothetical protein
MIPSPLAIRNRGMGAATKNPATALIEYTRGLEASQTPQAEWPYQWLFPSAHSDHVLAQGSAPTPDYTGGPASATILQYQVPDAYRFSLRGIVLAANVASWAQGSGDMFFNLSVLSGGDRNVDFLFNVLTELGSLQNGPFPIGGRLEFESLDVLQLTVETLRNVGIGAPNYVTGILWGHIYPNSENY